ncbi:dihydroxy-acid dehydratase [Mycolicibacterium aichiense]|uniref:Dehydratase IlvD1 n=1 Tax=Mycolicibacterium aichiense TaxID=1799 RepID=A0AAD1HP83_9MYCO|nr:dihydroxy-acid dehydratase [Mycolicibacterium aichiense]MCV7018642.1 dihydroxy-acid dehydratase [Mycolicibacterium aichiense]BBX07401.1 putative dehydratase IlvD1 [Mycolicibacterium aichiense]STZ81216.1 dihydroxy-acid dehydratase [Mycolicibacterium aichiense]
MTSSPHRLKSSKWFAGQNVPGFVHRSAMRASGFSRMAVDGRPIVGICNSWSEVVNCNMHFRGMADAVRRGVLAAGGFPLEFPTISLGEQLMKPTTMLFRNLMAMDVEESIRAYPFDAVVLLGGCDKTVPAQLMGATSADVPAIVLTGGPASPAVFNGKQLGVGTDLWHYIDEVRAGRMPMAEYDRLESAAGPSQGHCPEMGTASTMATLVEGLGMTLPGAAAVPAMDSRRLQVAEMVGVRAVGLAAEGLRPSQVLTAEAFDNAITLMLAVGGSTNAVVHLLAIAGRAGVELPLDRFHELSSRTPLVVNVRPAGQHLVEQVFHAGGIPAVMKAIEPLLHTEALTVTGKTVADTLPDRAGTDPTVIANLNTPFQPPQGLSVVRGNLAPNGAVIKCSAATADLLVHRGPAVVFDSMADMMRRFDDPDLEVTAESVLVLRSAGPRGAPGMPEWGQLPIPSKLLAQGVTDMVRISDARMSGTAYGTCVLHVSPESAVGGPLALVRDGDVIALDALAGRLDVLVTDDELAKRRAELPVAPAPHHRGYTALYVERVLQADQGCDFDFLVGRSSAPENEPDAVFDGWVGGW